MPIEIISGPIHSGKTTHLTAWCAAQPPGTVAGLLQPARPAGREFVDVVTGDSFPLDAPPDTPETAVQRVGRYAFATAAFEWAADCLARAVAAPTVQVIVVDEIGPLELRGQGLDAAVRAVLAAGRADVRVVLVVREGLVEAVRARYGS